MGDNNAASPRLPTLKELLRPIEIYLEEQPAANIAFRVVCFLVAALVGFFETVNVLGPLWSTTYTIITLILLLSFVLALDFGHVWLLDNRMKEIKKRDRHIDALKIFIRHSTDLQKVDYEYERYEWEYDILPSGDGRCVRSTIIKPTVGTVYSQDFLCGVTGDSPRLLTAEQVELKVTARPVGSKTSETIPQLFIFYQDYPAAKEATIVLDPPAIVGGAEYELRAEHQWAGLWRPLIEKCIDVGRIRVHHPVHHFKVAIRAPEGFRITNFSVKPLERKGDVIIQEQEGRSTIIWSAKDVPIGDINYTVHGVWENAKQRRSAVLGYSSTGLSSSSSRRHQALAHTYPPP